MDKFLGKYNLSELNQEAESLNRPITADKIEAVVKKLLAHKSPGPDSFTEEFYKIFKDELTPIFHRFPPKKIQEDRTCPKSFYEANIILIPKPGKDRT